MAHMESLWPRLAELTLVVESCEYDRLHAVLAHAFLRVTTHLRLLFAAADGLVAALSARLKGAGYADIRGAHGCVFGNIDPAGMRLTELAERAGMTKQAVGEAVSDLERLGYAERVADPSDGRAKIIRLTERGSAAQQTGFRIIGDLESEWIERYGADRVAELRAMLLDITGAPKALASAA